MICYAYCLKGFILIVILAATSHIQVSAFVAVLGCAALILLLLRGFFACGFLLLFGGFFVYMAHFYAKILFSLSFAGSGLFTYFKETDKIPQLIRLA